MAQSYASDYAPKGEQYASRVSKFQPEESTATAVDSLQRQAEDLLATTKSYVQQQPVLALALAASVGLAIGALWKLTPSRRSYSADLAGRVSEAIAPHYRALRRYW